MYVQVRARNAATGQLQQAVMRTIRFAPAQ
jgi:hypothetical protein